MLHKFIQAKQQEIQELQIRYDQGFYNSPAPCSRPGLQQALFEHGPGAVIAEYKRASPARGVINPNLDPQDAALAFARGGAAAASVLTMQKYFSGHMDYLQQMSSCALPLLRKDFILHPLQVMQTACSQASALLLIVRLFLQEPHKLQRLYNLSLESGLEPVLEIFNIRELELAQELRPKIIQVNSRDLQTLELDFATAREVITRKKPGQIWILASGIQDRSQMENWIQAGFDAFLVGTWIMSAPDPARSLASLTGILHQNQSQPGSQGPSALSSGQRATAGGQQQDNFSADQAARNKNTRS